MKIRLSIGDKIRLTKDYGIKEYTVVNMIVFGDDERDPNTVIYLSSEEWEQPQGMAASDLISQIIQYGAEVIEQNDDERFNKGGHDG